MKKFGSAIYAAMIILLIAAGVYMSMEDRKTVFPIEQDKLYAVIVSKQYPDRPNVHIGLPEEKIPEVVDAINRLNLQEAVDDDSTQLIYWLHSEAREKVLYEVMLMYKDDYKPTTYLYFREDGGIIADILVMKEYQYYSVALQQRETYREVLALLDELVPLCEVRK